MCSAVDPELNSLIHTVWIPLSDWALLNPFKPEFTMVIFIHYKPWFDVGEKLKKIVIYW